MAKLDNIIIGYKQVGVVKIDILEAINQWSQLWGIYQWDDEYRVIKYIRKDSPLCALKITISQKQAKILIAELNLIPYNNTPYNSAMTWKRNKDWLFFIEYREEQRLKRIAKTELSNKLDKTKTT